MDIILKLKEELNVEKWQVEAAVKLIDEGNTIPFISRYRKEATGALNDEVLRNLFERLTYLRNLEEKKEQVLGSIEEQGKLTDELKEKILAAETLVVVEDLYRPYRPKRKTRASVAKEKGLEPLAEFILAQETDKPVIEKAAEYISEEKEVKTAEEAIAGALDKHCREQRILLLKAFLMRQITAFILETLRLKKEKLPVQPRMKKRKVFMKCTMPMKNL